MGDISHPLQKVLNIDHPHTTSLKFNMFILREVFVQIHIHNVSTKIDWLEEIVGNLIQN